MNKDVKDSRIPIFDGLKGIAILTVIAYYFFEYIVPGGFLAVNAFLFIAGFFNFRHFYLADVKGRPYAFGKFLMKRFERLFFPLLFMITTTVTYILFFAQDYLANVRMMGLSALVFANNYYQIFNNQSYFVQAANPSPFTHLWYVSIYGQLVLLMPVFILLFYRWHKKPTVMVNILTIISLLSAFLLAYRYQPGQDPTGVYYDLLTRMSAFTFGGAVGLLLPPQLKTKPIPPKARRILNLLGLLAIVLAILMVKYMFGTQPFAYRMGLSLFTLVSAFIVLTSIHPDTIWNKIYRLKLLTFFGKRSFSYYLWYYPVYLLFPQNITLLNQSPWVHYSLQFGLIMILAEISYQLFEKRRWSLPIGQDFNFTKTVYQVQYLRSHPQQLTFIKIVSGIYAFILSMSMVGMVMANPEKGNKATEEITQIIESNKDLVSQTQNVDESTPVKVVNNIDGLDQDVLLFANGLDITFIGDSTLLAASSQVQEVFPKAIFDAVVGRQLYNSFDIVYSLSNQGLMKPTVVTMLGSNGTFTTGQIDDYIEAIGTDKEQYYLTVLVDRTWTADANRQLLNAAQRYSNVKIIDWATYANDHVDWFAEDGAHLNSTGSEELAKFLAKEIYRQQQ